MNGNNSDHPEPVEGPELVEGRSALTYAAHRGPNRATGSSGWAALSREVAARSRGLRIPPAACLLEISGEIREGGLHVYDWIQTMMRTIPFYVAWVRDAAGERLPGAAGW